MPANTPLEDDKTYIKDPTAVDHIVVVDDEEPLCLMLAEFLAEIDGVEVNAFTDVEAAQAHIESQTVDMVLTDLVIGAGSGVDILDLTLKRHPEAVVILMTAHPTVKTAISVLQRGGYDYLVKPFKLEMLRAVVERGLETLHIKRENVHLREELGLLKVSTALMSDSEVEDTLQLVVEAAQRDLGVQGVALTMQTGSARLDAIKVEHCDLTDEHGSAFWSKLIVAQQEASISQKVIHTEPTTNGQTGHRSFLSLPMRAGERCVGYLHACFERKSHMADVRMLELLTANAAAAVRRAMLDEQLADSYLSAIRALASAIEARDRYTAGHTDRVSAMTELIAVERGWSRKQILELRQGCMLHDIGKIGVPDAILNKNGPLTEYEMNIMRKHPEMGVHIISGLEFLKPAVPYILFHHERWDGKGYPMGLEAKEIPEQGRMLAVADTFDAMVSDRPYRRGATHEIALKELIDHKGTQFDAEVVDEFLKIYEEQPDKFDKLYGSKAATKSIRSLISEF
jgi:HD-GYP domain-containing protein (c-di-GMP phosphodiesterase class II)/FixJ family two-component response regulator